MKNLILSCLMTFYFGYAAAQQTNPQTPKQSKSKNDSIHKKNKSGESKKTYTAKDTLHKQKKSKTSKSAAKTGTQRKDTVK